MKINFKTIKNLYMKSCIPNEELNKIIELPNDAIITIEPPKYENNDEPIYLENIQRIFKIITTHNRTYNIRIKIENRELFKQANLLKYPNINLIISNDNYDYTQEEYLKEEEKLEKLISPIKNSNLSPYEKFLATYNIVKQFKPYKENYNDRLQSRKLKYILENEYIVCVGFSRLLTTLLDKVGIPSISIPVAVADFYHRQLSTKLEHHERNLIKIDDDKYNIHGIFIADSTWDNSIDRDLYNHSSMTFSKMKEAKRLEQLSPIDMLLDFNNFNEFLDKINFYIKRQIKRKYYKTEKENILYAYIVIYNNIMDILLKLDYQQYKKLYNKYHNLITSKVNINNLKTNIPLLEIEKIFSDFLTEYSEYIIPLSNQKITNDTVLSAATNVKSNLDLYTEEELRQWEKDTKIANTSEAKQLFPYIYNPKETKPNYLTTKENRKIR